MTPDTRNYRYLVSQTVHNLKDAEVFKETLHAFTQMGFSPEDTQTIFKVVCAVLLLGNVTFIPTDNGESSAIEDNENIEMVAQMLSVSPALLRYSICNYSIDSGKSRKSMITVPLKVSKASDTRDSLVSSFIALYISHVYKVA